MLFRFTLCHMVCEVSFLSCHRASLNPTLPCLLVFSRSELEPSFTQLVQFLSNCFVHSVRDDFMFRGYLLLLQAARLAICDNADLLCVCVYIHVLNIIYQKAYTYIYIYIEREVM